MKKLTKELLDEYTAYVLRDQQKELFTEYDNQRYSELLHEYILPAYKLDTLLSHRVQRIIDAKRLLLAVTQLHDMIKRQLIADIESIPL